MPSAFTRHHAAVKCYQQLYAGRNAISSAYEEMRRDEFIFGWLTRHWTFLPRCTYHSFLLKLKAHYRYYYFLHLLHSRYLSRKRRWIRCLCFSDAGDGEAAAGLLFRILSRFLFHFRCWVSERPMAGHQCGTKLFQKAAMPRQISP